MSLSLVVNDDVYTTFTLYTAGILTKEQTLEALKIKKLYNQLVLTSEKALSYLKFIGTAEQEDTKLWHFSPLTFFNMFDEEKRTGSFTFPEEV